MVGQYFLTFKMFKFFSKNANLEAIARVDKNNKYIIKYKK